MEAQVDLALESATMQGQAEVISANVELTSHLFDSSSFGDLSATVDAMDQSFAETKTPTIGGQPGRINPSLQGENLFMTDSTTLLSAPAWAREMIALYEVAR